MAEYTLRLSEHELNRYRMMASFAKAAETAAWEAAHIGPDTRIVDIGCGPGLPLLLLAEAVGADGKVVGVDQSDEAVETARALSADLPHVEICTGEATATGLPEGEWDVVHLRHVLLHNGPRIGEILAHAAELLRPGGRLYLNETDASAHRFEWEPDETILDLDARYWALVASLGNDLHVGPHLGRYVVEAGFEIVHRQARLDMFPLTPEIRPPSWAGRQFMLDAGVCTEADVERWDTALAERLGQGMVFVPQYTVVGSKP